jgi:hypothetical protein
MILIAEEPTFAQMVMKFFWKCVILTQAFPPPPITEIFIPLEYNPVLQQLEDERREAEETKSYIGDVSLEDILDQGPEEASAPIEQLQQEANQASRGLSSEEAKLDIGDVENKNELKMISKENYSDSSDGEGIIDAILKEALEDYEAQLSPPGDQLIADN